MSQSEHIRHEVEPIGSAVSEKRFAQLVGPMIGLPVSHAWKGVGTAILLELGPLRPPGPRLRQPKGIGTVMIEWSWRVEKARSIDFGAWSGRRKIEHGIQTLVGRTIDEIALVGRLPEISVHLSGSRWVHTFMTAEGQPAWSLLLPDNTCLHIRRGVIIHEQS